MREHVFELDDIDSEFCVNCGIKKNFGYENYDCLSKPENNHNFVFREKYFDWICNKCYRVSNSKESINNEYKIYYIEYNKLLINAYKSEHFVIIGCDLSDEEQNVKDIIQ